MNSPCETSDLLVFSHLRWNFVFQRPQHILSRFAQYRRVFYVEEPIIGVSDITRLHLRETDENVYVVTPHLPSGISHEEMEASLRELVDELIFEEELIHFTLWYYTPMAHTYTNHLKAQAVIYDCIDELSASASASALLVKKELDLLNIADVVFTAGRSLYEAKKFEHDNIHSLPNSIDYNHFSIARHQLVEPDDQQKIPHPRIGFYGIIDERIDLSLLEKMADLSPEFQFVMIGPVVRIDPATLPMRPNLHYLGKKEYHTLPLYLSGWDCTMMPFKVDESTRYLSPMKTPEFLAAAKPIVSTAVEDVIHPYADLDLVQVANNAQEFVEMIEKAMNERAYNPEWLKRVDAFLAGNSWDRIFRAMALHEQQVLKRNPIELRKAPAYMDESLSAIGIV